MLRQRSGLTQAQLAELLNLKSARMVRNWEGEFNLPTADRLNLLIKVYLERKIFLAGKEKEEARLLWQTVKDTFEAQSFNYETYPIFDEEWVTAQLSGARGLSPVVALTHHLPEDRTGTTPNNLPQLLNRLWGREADIASITALLQEPGKRLLTLTGVGGSGKTSLALAAGKTLLASFRDGVYFVGLENITGRENMLAAVTRTLEIKENPQQGLLEGLAEYLEGKQLLLILDNFEQLAPESGILSELLRQTTGLKLLVTSRVPLHLLPEQEYLLDLLPLPAKGNLPAQTPAELEASYPAITLFVERARAVKPDFVLNSENVPPVVEICYRLDGLPLALELGAARLRAFAPQKLLERLSLKVLSGGPLDLPARQQTLHATIGWSYDLLTQDEKRLFARLSIFAGGCSLDGAEAVCTTPEGLSLDMFEGLESLLSKNLLKRWEGKDGDTRYGMLVTIREFALEKLAESGEATALYRSYAGYYLTLLRKLEEMRLAGQDLTFWQTIDTEYDNYQFVIDRALADRQTELAQELCGILAFYWRLRGFYKSGESYLHRALALPDTQNNHPLKAKILSRLGTFANEQGDRELGRLYLEQALALYRALGDKSGIVFASLLLGEILYKSYGDYDQARRCFEEVITISEETGTKQLLATATLGLGLIALSRCDLVKAQGYIEKAQAIHRDKGFKAGLFDTNESLSEIFVQQGKYAEARRCLEELLTVAAELGHNLAGPLNELGFISLLQGNQTGAQHYFKEAQLKNQGTGENVSKGLNLSYSGWLALYQGNFEEVRPDLEEALVLFRKIGSNPGVILTLWALGYMALKTEDFSKAQACFAESTELCRKMSFVYEQSHNLTGLAAVLLGQSRQESKTSNGLHYLLKATRLCGAVSALLTATGTVPYPLYQELYDEMLGECRAKLLREIYEAAWAEGQTLTVEAAAVYALED